MVLVVVEVDDDDERKKNEKKRKKQLTDLLLQCHRFFTSTERAFRFDFRVDAELRDTSLALAASKKEQSEGQRENGDARHDSISFDG